MNIESNLSGHWTDEQLIEHLYGIGPGGKHIQECQNCEERLAAMIAARQAVEANASQADQVSFELLAAQRRKIYARTSEASSWRLKSPAHRWAAAAAMVVLLGGGAMLYEHDQKQYVVQSQNKLTDAQLAQEVSQLAQDSEPSPTAPLEGLFDQ